MRSDKDFETGDTVYWAETQDANLEHQPDGVELYRGIVKKDEMEDTNDLYVFYEKLVYNVGKDTSAGGGGSFDPVGHTRFNLYGFIQSMHLKIFKELVNAQKDMIIKIFSKEKWL
jgi:hypothetical protein